MAARDCLALRPLLQPVLERGLLASVSGPAVAGMDMAALVAAGRTLLVEQPRSPEELGALLAQRWPDRDPRALAFAVRNLVPLVQVTPRGVWGAGGATRHAVAEAWLSRPFDHGCSTGAACRALPGVITKNGMVLGTVLLDGFVRGVWKLRRDQGSPALVVQPYAPINREGQAALEDEGRRLLALACGGAACGEVQIAAVE